MEESSSEYALMFADIAGSSQLYKTLGDVEANRTVALCIQMMKTTVIEHRGIVVKTLGDEVMASFESAEQACNTAIELQRKSHTGAQQLSLRIGMSFGPAIAEQGDLYGEAVNDAAFVAKIAQAEQIIITEPLANRLIGQSNFIIQAFDHVKLKGSEAESTIYRVDWEQTLTGVHPDSTISFNLAAIDDTAATKITLQYRQQTIGVEELNTPFVIGRDSGSDLFVESDFASRAHLNIVFRRGKFVLVDQSTNGTYVQFNDTEAIYLRREELPLLNQGKIALGQPVDKAGLSLIEFRVE